MWAYDALDLLDVKNGLKQPWTVRPYAVWQMDFPTPSWTTYINGAAYDPATGRIFISQGFANGELPMVHVYRLDLR